jgi:adhesin transport system outer membrane protein
MKHIAFKTLALGSTCVALMMLTGPALAQDAGMMPTNPPDMQAGQDAQMADAAPAAPTTAPMAAPAPVLDTMTPAPALPDAAATAMTPAAAAHPVAPLHNQDNKIMNLSDVVAVGLSSNPEYHIVANNRRATDEELNQAVDLYFPSIDARTDAGYEHTNNPSTRATYTDGRSGNMWRYQTGVTLTQLLFDGWETAYENQRQKFRVLSASNRVREASELVGLSIVESYLEVMRQRELLKNARDNVSQHMDILNQISDSSSAGRTTAADVDQARARVSSARAEEASVREALRIAEAGFIQQAGDVPRDLVMPTVPVDQLAPDVEQEVKQTQYASPTISIKQADIDVAHAEMDKAKAPMYPKFDLQVNGRTGDNLNGVHGQDTSASALVVMNWNLYRGGGDVARVREAIDRWSQAKADRMKSQRDVDNDVRQTWARMVSAGERARQFATQADANVEVVKAYKDQFNLNRRTLLDVLDSQNEEYVSRSNMINAEYIEIFAVYRLLALKGELMKTLGIELPREAIVANK